MISQCDTCGARERNGECANDYCPSNIERRGADDIVGGGCLLATLLVAAFMGGAVAWLFYTVWTLSQV